MARTCFERFQSIILITRKMAAVCGADFAREGYKVNFHTWFVIIAINAFLAFTFYTIYYGLMIEGDWKIMLQCLSTIGSGLQGYSKLMCAMSGRPYMLFLLKQLNDVYKECELDEDYLPVLKYHIGITTKMLKGVVTIYVLTVVVIVAIPLIYGRILGEKLLIMQFLLPGVDPETDNGYLIYIAYHFMCVFFAAFGNSAGDMFIFISITHIPLFKDVFRIKCVKLNRLIDQKESSKKTMPELKKVLQWHQHYNTYVEHVEVVYYLVVFVQIFTSVLSICCTLFCMLIRSWPAAFAYLIYTYTMLLAFCSLGNLVEISNDEIIDIIYGTLLWYDLSVPEQKLVLLMLRKSQKPTTLSVGHIMPLSMETALKLTKAIYSYMMMLVNFLYGDDM